MRGVFRGWSRLLLVLALLGTAELLCAGAIPPPGTTVGEHPTRFWALNPGTAFPEGEVPQRVNSLGLRGEEPERSAPGPRVLLLGDSVIYGVYLPPESTLDRLLETELRQATGQPWHVFNGGVPGYTTFQGLDMLEEVGPQVRPDVVMVYFGCNDMSFDVQSDHERAPGWPFSDLRRVLWRSAMYQVLRAQVLGIPVGRPGPLQMSHPGDRPRVPIDRFRENLRQIARRSRALGARTVIFLQLPQRGNKVPPMGAPVYGDELLAVGEEEGLALDVEGRWRDLGVDPEGKFLPGDPYHFSVEGSPLVARTILALWREREPGRWPTR